MKRYAPDWLRRVVRRCVRDAADRSEAGDTLLEVLIALVVLSVASVALLVSFATSISATSTYRDVATLDSVLRSASEEVITQIQQQPAALFASCGGAANVTFSLPSGYSASITAVSYWNSVAFISTCVPNAPQWITIKVTETLNAKSATNNFIVDDPLARPIVTPGNATQLVYIEQPGNASINTALTPEPVVAIEDASGNIVTTDLSPVTLAITPGTGTNGAALSSGCSGTEFYGVVTFSSCTINLAGQGYTLTASDGSLSAATSNAFSVSSGVATQLVFTSQPGSSSGGSTLSTQPVVDVEDANGLPVTIDNSTVSLAVTPSTGSSGATLSGCTQSENAGVVTFTGCAVSLAGNAYTLTASDGTLTTAISSPFNIAVGAAAKLVFTTQPVGAAAGTSLATQPVVKVEDAAGNVVTSASTSITLSASGGALSSCSGLTANSGVVSVTGCTFAGLVDTSYTLSASANGLVTATSSNFGVTVGLAAKLVFTTATAGVASSNVTSAFTTQPVVTVEDSSGNVVSNYVSSITLTISGGESLSCTSGTTKTPVSGAAVFSGCAGSVYASNVTLSASSTGLTGATSPSFDISGVPTQLAFSTQPSNTAEGVVMTPGVVVSVEDSSGRVATTSSALIAVALGTNPGTGTLSGTTPVAAVSGAATFSNLSINALGSGYTLNASTSGFAPVSSNSFNVIVGAPSQLVFTTQPASGASGAVLTTQPVVKVEDSAGNVVASASTTITLIASGGTLAACTGLTATSGVVNVANCTFAGLVGTSYTLSASATGLTGATSTNFSPSTYGTATKLVFTTQPASGASGAVLSTQPVVKVEDSAGNVVASASTTITLIASGGTLAACTGLTATSGVVNVANCTFAGLVGTSYTLSASATGLTGATSTNFSPSTYGTATKLVFTTPTHGVASSSASSAFTTQPVVSVEDSAGNVVANYASSITLSISAGETLSCTAGDSKTPTSGVASFSGCAGNAYATGVTLTASSSGLTSVTGASFNISNVATQLVFTVQPSNSTHGSTITPSVVVSVEDSSGRVVTTSAAPIAVAIGNNPGSGTLSGTTPVTAVNGVATFSNLSISAAGSGYTLKATSSGLTTATSSSFTES